jgi:two-component system NtrC family sensor kinase
MRSLPPTPRRPIAHRIILSVGIGLVAMLGPGSWLLMRSVETRVLEEVHAGGDRLARTLARSLRFAMLNDDRRAVDESVRAVGTQQDLVGIRIFNKDGRVQFASRVGDVGQAVALTQEACRGCHSQGRALVSPDPSTLTNTYVSADGTRVLERIEPIYNEPDCSTAACHVHPSNQKVLGVMDVSVSLASFDRDMATFRRTSLGGSLGVLALTSVVILLLVRRIIARRIKDLVHGTRTISEGDLDHRIPVSGEDELAWLARSFNNMTATLQETRGQLFRSERLASLGQMAASIAHEINNPLTGVMLLSSAVMAELPEGDDKRAKLQTVLDETRRCREVIKGLLSFARATPPRREPTRVEEVVDRAFRIVDLQAKARTVTLVVKGGDPLPQLVLDPSQLEQVFVNLMVNAVDATPQAGTVEVRWRVVEDTVASLVEIDVTDTGSGIPPSALPRIFEPFFTTKENGKGTGLGLAVSWGIVQQHGGTIGVRSEQGKGTVFTVRLPVPAARS